MRSVSAIVILIGAVLSLKSAEAAEVPLASLFITNPGNETIYVYCKRSEDKQWPNSMVLHGHQTGEFDIIDAGAFDILFRLPGNRLIKYPNAMVYSLTRRGKRGIWKCQLEGIAGWVVKENGREVAKYDTGCPCAVDPNLNECRRVTTVKATPTSVILSNLKLTCEAVQKKPDDPNPPDPDPKKPPKDPPKEMKT